jgi:hypothetical protein
MNPKIFSNLQDFDRSQHFASWPCSLNRDRPVFSFHTAKNRKYHILILVFHERSRASSQNQLFVTKHKATEKVQYLHQLIFAVFDDCTLTL